MVLNFKWYFPLKKSNGHFRKYLIFKWFKIRLFSIVRRPRYCRRLRLPSSWSRLRHGTSATSGILQFVRRLVGLLGLGQPTADHRLAVRGRYIGGRRKRSASCVAQRNVGAVAIPGGRLPSGHPQHYLSVCRVELGGTHYIAGRASASRWVHSYIVEVGDGGYAVNECGKHIPSGVNDRRRHTNPFRDGV